MLRFVGLATVLVALVWLGCPGRAPGAGEGEGEGEGEECQLTLPEAWTAPAEWEQNAAGALALRAQLDALTVTLMRQAEEGTAVVDDVEDLNILYRVGTPSLADITSARAQPLVAEVFAGFVELVAAGAQDLVDAAGLWTGGTAGGIYGTSFRGFNAGGIELRQIVDKGLFGGAALYRYASGLTSGEITPATIDAITAAWGSNAALDPSAPLTDSANYTNRMGYHDEAAAALIEARLAAADPACIARRDAALVRFFRTWERSVLARNVYYMHRASTTVTAMQTDDAYAAGLHDLSEGIGLLFGFLGLDSPAAGPLLGAARVVSDADLEAVLDVMGVDRADLGASTTGPLLVEQSYAGPIAAAEAILVEALDAPAAELQIWRTGAN